MIRKKIIRRGTNKDFLYCALTDNGHLSDFSHRGAPLPVEYDMSVPQALPRKDRCRLQTGPNSSELRIPYFGGLEFFSTGSGKKRRLDEKL